MVDRLARRLDPILWLAAAALAGYLLGCWITSSSYQMRVENLESRLAYHQADARAQFQTDPEPEPEPEPELQLEPEPAHEVLTEDVAPTRHPPGCQRELWLIGLCKANPTKEAP